MRELIASVLLADCGFRNFEMWLGMAGVFMFSVKQGIVRLHQANQQFWFVYALLAVPIVSLALLDKSARSNLIELIKFNYGYILAVMSGQTTQLDLLIGLPLAIVSVLFQLGFVSLILGISCHLRQRVTQKTCAGFWSATSLVLSYFPNIWKLPNATFRIDSYTRRVCC